MARRNFARRLPVGAEVTGEGVHVRVWAPKHDEVSLVLEGAGDKEPIHLEAEPQGYFSTLVPELGVGTRYRFLASGAKLPDPASRWQPDGPHGPSVVVDPALFRWTDSKWPGVRLEGQVIYEIHIGTFTQEGTFRSAIPELEALAKLGVTVLEVMPLAEFCGEFGWGYDGVCLFAPYHAYGTPDDARAFVDRAHALGLGVILDVVYNHLGPDGNYLSRWSDDYFSERHHTEWGAAIAFDGPRAHDVREYFTSNASYWIDEFHFDGLRLDATQSLFDSSEDHILSAIGRRVRQAARGRNTIVVAENEPQQSKLVRREENGGYGLDALWNDDFHHTARVALTGRAEAYYSDYAGSPQELVSALKWGFLYQGQRYSWQNARRGSPSLDLPPEAKVIFLENHDQVANSGRGERLHRLTSAGRHRALVALYLLAPQTPMLFQGEEFASSSPFLFFADHTPELAQLVHKGRREFLAQFPTLKSGVMQDRVDAPHDRATFERSKLAPEDRRKNTTTFALYQDLIHLRKTDAVFARPRSCGMGGRMGSGVDGAVLGSAAFLVRFFGDAGDERLILVNLGRDLTIAPPAEPLLAPPAGRHWRSLWSSEAARYGGNGATNPEEEGGWHLLGESAVVLTAERNEVADGP